MFIVYAFDENEKLKDGTEKSKQRWEQCINHVSITYRKALQALYAKRYFNKEIHDSAKDFAKEAVTDVISELNSRSMDDDAKHDVIEKLKTIQYVIGYPDEVLDLQKIEEFYKDLELNGTEEIVESFLKIENFKFKIWNSPKSNWKKKLYDKFTEDLKYYIDDNILCKFKSIQYQRIET